jgi:hypothetical protein
MDGETQCTVLPAKRVGNDANPGFLALECSLRHSMAEELGVLRIIDHGAILKCFRYFADRGKKASRGIR